MKNKLKLISIIFLIMFSIVGCKPNNKEELLYKDVNKHNNISSKDLLNIYQEAEDDLNAGNYNDAKKNFCKVIEISNDKKHMFLAIKDKYMSIGRLDDAYYFIKLAISYKIDTVNMEKILQEIKSKFEVKYFSYEVKKNEDFKLPETVKLKINNEDTDVNINWNKEVDTSVPGVYTYTGIDNVYDHIVYLTLTVKEPVVRTLYGRVVNSYKENNKYYLIVDEFDKIYIGDEAKQKLYENKLYVEKEDGKKEFCFSVYAENVDETTKTYCVSDNCKMRFCIFDDYKDRKGDSLKKIDESYELDILGTKIKWNDKYKFCIKSIEDINDFMYSDSKITVCDDVITDICDIPECATNEEGDEN